MFIFADLPRVVSGRGLKLGKPVKSLRKEAPAVNPGEGSIDIERHELPRS